MSKPHVMKDGMPGKHPWTARVNPGSGMFTVARRFPTWGEAFRWLELVMLQRRHRTSASSNPKEPE
jgi:hypothetical protein